MEAETVKVKIGRITKKVLEFMMSPLGNGYGDQIRELLGMQEPPGTFRS